MNEKKIKLGFFPELDIDNISVSHEDKPIDDEKKKLEILKTWKEIIAKNPEKFTRGIAFGLVLGMNMNLSSFGGDEEDEEIYEEEILPFLKDDYTDLDLNGYNNYMFNKVTKNGNTAEESANAFLEIFDVEKFTNDPIAHIGIDCWNYELIGDIDNSSLNIEIQGNNVLESVLIHFDKNLTCGDADI